MEILPVSDYDKAASALEEVTVNSNLTRAVVENRVIGKIYVDNITDPEIFYVSHPYGMSLLFGNVNDSFIKTDLRNYILLKDGLRTRNQWMQIFPTELESKIDSNFRSCQNVIKHRRINFKFNKEIFDRVKSDFPVDKYNFSEIDEKLFTEFGGSVVPAKFWKSAADFVSHGMGYAVIIEGFAAAISFSAVSGRNMLEIGLETKPEFRRKGLASVVCAKLITYCIEHELEPEWACCKDNLGSYNLALKLGFEPYDDLPYYEILV